MKRKLLYAILALAVVLTGCNLLKAVSLAKCNFDYDSVSDFTFLDMTPSQMLSLSGGARLTQALLGKTETAPLGMILHIRVDNPNKQEAALRGLYYNVYLDTVYLGDGNSIEPFVVPADTSAIMPLRMSIDLKSVLKSDKRPTVVKAVKQLANLAPDTTHVTVNLQPTIQMGQNAAYTYPKFIPVTFDIVGKN